MVNLETAVILVRVDDRTLLKHGCHLHLQDAALFSQAVPYTLGKVGKSGMVLFSPITEHLGTRLMQLAYLSRYFVPLK